MGGVSRTSHGGCFEVFCSRAVLEETFACRSQVSCDVQRGLPNSWLCGGSESARHAAFPGRPHEGEEYQHGFYKRLSSRSPFLFRRGAATVNVIFAVGLQKE